MAFGAFVAVGCQSTPAGPVEPGVMNDTDAPMGDRRRAVRQAASDLESGTDVEAARESLKNVIWRRANYWTLRTEALDALLEDEANLDDTRAMLSLLLPTESVLGSQDMLRHIGDVAAKRGWTDLTPGFVVSFSHPILGLDDDDRAEYDALRRLHPREPLPDVVFEVFTGRFENVELRERDRLAAWGLLRRLDPEGERTTELLASYSGASGDPLLETLKAAATDLRAVPATGEQLDWVRQLRAEHRGFWSEARDAIARLTPEQLEGFELRHASAVRYAATFRPEWLSADRAALLRDVEQRLDGAKHYAQTGGSNTQANEALRRSKDELVWADLLLIGIALDALDNDALADELFRQAEGDKEDTSTEHGGVLDARGAGESAGLESAGGAVAEFVAWPYPPRPSQRLGDTRFVASDDLLNAGAAALFHYHFHASTYDNRKYAGPSLADLEYARQYGRSCVVFTFITRDRLNADYYQPDGARVDLGSIERP